MSTALPQLSQLDDGTLTAIQVLALAIQHERVPGVVELHQAADALSRAYASRSPDDLIYAGLAFESLDPDLRARVAARAQTIARSSDRAALPTPMAPPKPRQIAPRRPPARPVSGFLAALNHGIGHNVGHGPTPLAGESSTNARGARDRLMSDLGRANVAVGQAKPMPPKWWE